MVEDAVKAARSWRRRAIATWAALAAIALLLLAALFRFAAGDATENIVLSRNEAVRSGAGARAWRGAFWNQTDNSYADLDAIILFLDADGVPVGSARGGAPRLDPGEVFDLAAPLPAAAARMQVYRLRWTGPDGGRAVLGPYRAWAFGYVMGDSCGELRLRIGSCTPPREVR